MIRSGLPLPTMMRIHLKARITANCIARKAQSIRKGVLTTINNDIAVLRKIPSILSKYSGSVNATANINELIVQFDDHYQNLIDLFCWSAKDGLHSGRDEKYAELRRWFIEHYESVRPTLVSALKVEPADLHPTDDCLPAPRDTFESLFLPPNPDVIINSETIISRLERTRIALAACREKLPISSE